MKTQKQDIPKTLLISTAIVTEDHLSDVLDANQVERDWYMGIPGYDGIEQIKTDVAIGTLVQVYPDGNTVPIMRLRNPKLHDSYPPFLKQAAAKVLTEIGSAWRTAMNEASYDQTITIAITSMIRTMEYQATIVAAGKLADPNSVHTRGGAFDLDASGYYLDSLPINPRTGLQADFDMAFEELGINDDAPRFGDQALYQPKVHELLKAVLQKLQANGRIHFIHEFPGTGNDVFHVCYNPGYQP
jgi:hypothetical protein